VTNLDNDKHQFAFAKARSNYGPNFMRIIPESCAKYRSEAQNALFLKRSWSDFDPQAYYLYGENQNHETSFKDTALQAAADIWCKIQVIACFFIKKYRNSSVVCRKL
jgi:hypothetical protein